MSAPMTLLMIMERRDPRIIYLFNDQKQERLKGGKNCTQRQCSYNNVGAPPHFQEKPIVPRE